MSSVVYFDTIAHDFFLFSPTKSSVFSQQFSCESHKLLNLFDLTFYKSELEQTG